MTSPPRQCKVDHPATVRRDREVGKPRRRIGEPCFVDIDLHLLFQVAGITIEIESRVVLVPGVLEVDIPRSDPWGFRLRDPIGAIEEPELTTIVRTDAHHPCGDGRPAKT